MKKIILTILFLTAYIVQAQYSNRIWCFGDSAGVDFTIPNNPSFFTSYMDCRGSCCSIADSSGLLFYANTGSYFGPNTFKDGSVKNKYNLAIQNGDSLVGENWYNEMIIVPNPGISNTFYVFHIGATLIPGVFYSAVDMSANGGLGSVVLKNFPLQNFYCLSSTTAIKHGNGRDWWIVLKQSGVQNPNNSYYEYLISPAGISGPYIYTLGSVTTTDAGHFNFNHKGDKLAYTDMRSIIEIYDFDRCTGVISNAVNINPQNLNPPALCAGIAFSPNDSVLYVSTSSDTSYIFQYDLTAANIASTKDTVASFSNPRYYGGFLKLAPDNKIYWSCAWNNFTFNYPYPDTAYYPENMNLSVINSPDSLGTACNFTPLSFYLGGKRTYYGLPNNPDYNLGAWVGSLCDTLGVGMNEVEKADAELKIYYHAGWQKAFVNAIGLKGSSYALRVIDSLGKIIFEETGKTQPPYFTKNINCTVWPNGVYFVSLITEREKLTGKFVKQ